MVVRSQVMSRSCASASFFEVASAYIRAKGKGQRAEGRGQGEKVCADEGRGISMEPRHAFAPPFSSAALLHCCTYPFKHIHMQERIRTANAGDATLPLACHIPNLLRYSPQSNGTERKGSSGTYLAPICCHLPAPLLLNSCSTPAQLLEGDSFRFRASSFSSSANRSR